MKNKKELTRLKRLIEEGKRFNKKCPSIDRFVIKDTYNSERNCSRWFTQTTNFLEATFGQKSIQITSFKSCFGAYESKNMLGMYAGEIHFAKDDMKRAIGQLEGIYNSFKRGEIKKRNLIFESLYKIWKEIKSLMVLLNIFKERTT